VRTRACERESERERICVVWRACVYMCVFMCDCVCVYSMPPLEGRLADLKMYVANAGDCRTLSWVSVKRALYLSKRALYLSKKALYLVKEPFISKCDQRWCQVTVML